MESRKVTLLEVYSNSLGLSSKVKKNYQEKDAIDEIEVFDARLFAEELISYARKKCKVKKEKIETTEKPDAIEISFSLVDGDEMSQQLIFVIAKESANQLVQNHFGLGVNDSTEGLFMDKHLEHLYFETDNDEVIEPGLGSGFSLFGEMYPISRAYLKKAQEKLYHYCSIARYGNSLMSN